MRKYLHLSILIISLAMVSACQDSARSGRDLSDAFLQNQPAEEVEPVDTTPEPRPDDAFRISSYCACRGETPILAGTGCESTCESKSTAQNQNLDMLYLNVIVDPAISLTTFQNLQGWCLLEVPNNPAQANPQCDLTVRSSETGQSLGSEAITVSGNEAVVDITSFPLDQTLVLKIVESQSGSDSANEVQIRKKLIVENPFEALGPVVIDPLDQYTCIINLVRTQNTNGQITYVSATKAFFYQSTLVPFTPLPAAVNDLYCYDFISEGQQATGPNTPDQTNFPRLETVAGAFSLWRRDDVRFQDNWSWKQGDGGGSNGDRQDILDLIDYEVYKQTLDTSFSIGNIFNKLDQVTPPQQFINGFDSSDFQGLNFGYYMSPLSKDFLTTYCPDNSDYTAQNANPIDIALQRLLGVETEPLYVSKSLDPGFYTDANGIQQTLPERQIYIARSRLDSLSYYINSSGLKVAPTEEDMDSQTIYFHWPAFSPTGGSRFIQTPNQVIFQIIKPDAQQTSGIIPKDGKIGCVPKSGS